MRKSGFRLCIIGTAIYMTFLFLPVSAVLAASDDKVNVGLAYDPSTVNTLEMRQGSDLPVILPMHESLIVSHPVTGERIPLLAESYTVMENKKDILFKIRKDRVFHTGDMLTAHDIKFTYDQCADPKNANMFAGMLDEIEEIEVIDDYTLIFHFWEPYAPWKGLMWFGICSKNYYEKVGPEKFRSHPVGSGQFQFVDRHIGESVTLERFPGYQPVNIEGYPRNLVEFRYLKFVTVPDDVTRLAMLETGELDLVSSILPHQLKRLKKNKHVIIKKSDQAPSLVGIAALPKTDPVMADRYLGLALRHGINRQEIVDKILLGEGYPLYTYASRSELGYDPQIKYDFDLEKAREFLRRSSYKKGTPLTLTYTNLVPNAPLIATIIQQYLKQIGITIKLQKLEEGTAATYTRTRDKRLGHLRLYLWDGGRDPDIRLKLSIVSTSPYASVTERPRWKEMDAMVEAQARETDEIKRAAILKSIHNILADDAIGCILFGQNMIYGMSDRIDYTWTPNEAFLFNVQMIKMKK